RPDVLCAHATHLQPAGRSGVWIGHVHPPPLLWIAHHAQRAPTRFEFRTVRPHARDLGARVGDHFDCVANVRTGRAVDGRVGHHYRFTGWMQDHRALIGGDGRSRRDAADTVGVAAGLRAQDATLHDRPVTVLAALERTHAVHDILLVGLDP